jgi:hypothetical protein
VSSSELDSRAIQAQLVRILGRRTGPIVAGDLVESCSDYINSRPYSDFAAFAREGRRLLRRICALERVWTTTHQDLAFRFRPDMTTTLSQWRAYLESYNTFMRQPKGRPKSHGRRRLAGDVGVILHRSGVRLTKARTGQLAQVLQVAFRAVGEPAPHDLFDIVEAAITEAVRRLHREARRRRD